MDATLKHIAFNRLLVAGNLLIICFFLVFSVWLEYIANNQAESIRNESIVINITQPELLSTISHTLHAKINIFDISGELWTIPEKKKESIRKITDHNYLKENEINGLMVLPSFSGIFVDGKFIKSGSKIKQSEIQQIKDGKVQLETPNGAKTYNLQKSGDGSSSFFKKTTL